MSDHTLPVVVKRIKKGSSAPHGGAWKIAYSDFVTAMMAFFLLLWLLGSTSEGDLKGIAEFFQNPMMVVSQGGRGVGDANSIIQGGGQDLTRTTGQVKRGSEPENRSLREQRREYERRERQSLERLKAQIEETIEKNPDLRMFRNQILLELTSEGLRIQIVDNQNRPMFDLASDRLRPHTIHILHRIGEVLNDVPYAVPYRLSIAGHTDAAQFAGGPRGFSNWELSALRANASRRELVTGGLNDARVLRVVGLASSVLSEPNDPLSPMNRRISIVVLNKRTEMSILSEGGADVELDHEDEDTLSDLAGRFPQ
ncbi:MAG: flagellar motor protein MotB [Betaproteobacteria bacterium]|nr:flagellar motor protein MotB [Betaproteobacteria bacterium]